MRFCTRCGGEIGKAFGREGIVERDGIRTASDHITIEMRCMVAARFHVNFAKDDAGFGYRAR